MPDQPHEPEPVALPEPKHAWSAIAIALPDTTLAQIRRESDERGVCALQHIREKLAATMEPRLAHVLAVAQNPSRN